MSERFDREGFAEHYARRHLRTDEGVDEIYYLPTGAPSREIRLLEVNHLISEMSDPEPIDFGVNSGAANGHTLLVLDLTPAQWKAVQERRLALPLGWSLDASQRYTREEAAAAGS